MIPFDLQPRDRVLVLAASPGSESRAAGGTLARLAQAGIAVHVLSIATFGDARGGEPSVVAAEFQAACSVLGVTGRVLWRDSTGRSPERERRELIDLIRSGSDLSLQALRPALVILPCRDDTDGALAVHQAGVIASDPNGDDAPRLLVGLANSRIMPSTAGCVVVTTSDHWEAKEKALDCYTDLGDTALVREEDMATGARIRVAIAEAFVPHRLAY